MKVLGFAPQLMQPSAPGAERIDRAQAAEDLQRLRVATTSHCQDPLSSDSNDASEEGLDQQTRAGLRRLAQMIRKSNNKKSTYPVSIDPKRTRALASYAGVSNAIDRRVQKGSFLDKIF